MESLAGFRFPIQHGIKAAIEIRRDEGGKNPPDPQASRVFQSIMAAAAQSHRSNGQDTSLHDELIASGKLTAAQEKTLSQAISEPPIVFAVRGLDHAEDVYQVFQHSTPQEKSELLENDHSWHRMYAYQQQLRETGHDEEAEKTLDEITRK